MATIHISDTTYAKLAEAAQRVGVTPDELAETWLTPPSDDEGDGVVYDSLEEFFLAVEAEGKRLEEKRRANL